MSIPKIIFQTWKSKTDIPDNFRYWSETFKSENPGYVYRLWDDADNRAFVEKNFPWFIERYDGYPAEIYRADAVRYFFLYMFGGIYADMDTECLKPLDVLTGSSGIVLGRMGADPSFDHSLPNAIMASEPRQEFWLFVMSLMFDPPKSFTVERPEYQTGPVMLKTAFDTYTREYRSDIVQLRLANIRTRMNTNLMAALDKSDVKIVPGPVFYPVDWNDPIHDRFVRQPIITSGKSLSRDDALSLFPNSLTATYWSHSWENQHD